MVAIPTLPRLDVMLVHQESFYVLDGYQVNLGVLSLATVLNQQKYSVKILSNIDLYMLRNVQIQYIFKGYKPRIVGFYTMTDNIHHVVKLAKRIKAWSPQSVLTAGGPLASALGSSIAQSFPFDYIIKGEGEYSLPQLADYVIHGKGSPETIPGLIYRDGDTYREGAPSQYITDLDALPDPDRDLIPRSLRLNISSGRGCPNSCTFCFQAVHGKGYRFRSADRVFQEIAGNIDKCGYKAFDIIDDTFVAEPERVLRFCELLREYRRRTKRDFIWYCEARVDTLSQHPELVQAMKDTGLIRLQVGIESGDNETLRRYGKRLDLVKLRDLCQLVNEIDGISIFGNFIIGGPYETEASLAKSHELLRELLHTAPGLFEANTGFLAPYPETPIGRRPDLFGLTVEDDEYLTSITPEDCYCSTPELSRPELRRHRFEFLTDMFTTMNNMLPTISKKRLMQHFYWFKTYNTQTRWFNAVMQPLPAVATYFRHYDNPKFSELSKIRPLELGEWIPLRTIAPLQYDHSDWENYLLTGSYEDMSITDPLEKDIYALSVGKLNIREIMQELRRRHSIELSDTALWKKHVYPMFKKLEDHFQIIFHE